MIKFIKNIFKKYISKKPPCKHILHEPDAFKGVNRCGLCGEPMKLK